MKIQESAENYLETILKLSEVLPRVRAIDIVNDLGFSKPSVSIAMKHLKEEGLIKVATNGAIELTDSGREIATKTYEKEKVLVSVLLKLGVSKNQAEIDACKIEHVLSDESFNAIKGFIKNDN